MKTISIQLYGGPGTGKSTTAALLYARLKQYKHNAELVREYVKDWVWEGRQIKSTDQIYLLAKQARKEQILFTKVETVISDSPIWQSPVYEKKYSSPPFVCQGIVDKFEAEAKAHGVEYKHIFLRRVKPYNPEGRFQSEEEAKVIDAEIKQYLIDQKMDFIEIDADENADISIMKALGLL